MGKARGIVLVCGIALFVTLVVRVGPGAIIAAQGRIRPHV